MHEFKKLKIWQRSYSLVSVVYSSTADIRKEEKYGLISQIRKCAVSIPSNIAEGAGRSSNKDFARFLSIAIGSAFELETQLMLCKDLKFVDSNKVDSMISELNEIQKMIRVFLIKLES